MTGVQTCALPILKARLSQCPVKQGKVDLSKYEKLDTYWRDLGVAAPARRGLVDNKILKLTDLKKVTKEDFMNIHAMGPAAAKLITHEMRKKGIKFKSS